MKKNFLNSLKEATNYTYTDNGAVTNKSTLNKVLDMFALGGAYRNRATNHCIDLFRSAFDEDATLALKCLFYLRDCRGGQGERRFFRVCINWLAKQHTDRMKNLIEYIPEYGRWDDLFSLVDTPLEEDAFAFIRHQLVLDMESQKNGISLCAKWCPSENTSNAETVKMAKRFRKFLGISSKDYRKMLSGLREKIKVLERLMSANRWDEIEFDKIPSKAGLIYKNAFATKEVTRARYEAFMNSKETKVNAAVLYPYDVVKKIPYGSRFLNLTDINAIQKYWDNLPNYYGDREENGLAIIDVSGSMTVNNCLPLYAAVGMGMYIADKAHGPFANHFITFSAEPELVEMKGDNIVEKFNNIVKADWGWNTDLKAVFDLLLNTAVKKHLTQDELPDRLYIFSDMHFDSAFGFWRDKGQTTFTLIDNIKRQWERYGYKMPSIVFWNLNASADIIPALDETFSYVSGYSPVLVEQILSGKTNIELMLDKLLSKRYENIK